MEKTKGRFAAMLEKAKSGAGKAVVLAVGALGAAPAAMASGGGGVDYSTLLADVDFSTIQPVVMGVAGALAGIYVVIKGVNIVLGFLR